MLKKNSFNEYKGWASKNSLPLCLFPDKGNNNPLNTRASKYH